MPDYVSQIFQGLQAGASMGHMLRQAQQADETNRRMALASDRQWQVQQQQMAQRDVDEKQNLATNAVPVFPDGTVQGMLPPIEGGGDGVPDIPAMPGVMKSDPSRTVDYGGQKYQLLGHDEQVARALAQKEAEGKQAATTAGAKKKAELQAEEEGPTLSANPLLEKYFGVKAGTQIPIGRYDKLMTSLAKVQNAESLETQRNAKADAVDADPVMHTFQVPMQGGQVGVVTVTKSGKVSQPAALPGSISSEHVQAGTQANISGRESAKEAAIGARQQEAEKAKIEAELVKTDSGISQLTVQQMQLNKALAKNDGARVTVPDAKGKPTVVTLTPDTRVELASQRDILHQQRTDAVARRNARASAVGWAPHQATDANLQPAGAAAAPAAAAPAAAATQSQQQQAPPSAIATPKPGTIITFNGKKGLWTGTGFTAIK